MPNGFPDTGALSSFVPALRDHSSFPLSRLLNPHLQLFLTVALVTIAEIEHDAELDAKQSREHISEAISRHYTAPAYDEN